MQWAGRVRRIGGTGDIKGNGCPYNIYEITKWVCELISKDNSIKE